MYFLPTRVNQIIMKTVNIYPIISYPMNQSGQFVPVGKNVDGEIQFKNVNPEKSAHTFTTVNPEVYIPQINETIRTT